MEKGHRDDPYVWVQDSEGNKFMCPMSALKDPTTVSEEEKANCIDKVPGEWMSQGP